MKSAPLSTVQAVEADPVWYAQGFAVNELGDAALAAVINLRKAHRARDVPQYRAACGEARTKLRQALALLDGIENGLAKREVDR